MSLLSSSESQVSPNLAHQLEQLRLSYIERLPAKIEALEDAWREVLRCEKKASASNAEGAAAELHEALAVAHRLFHSLAGSGATFGLPEVSRLARASEIVLKAALQNEAPLDQKAREIVENSHCELRRLLEQSAPEAQENLALTPETSPISPRFGAPESGPPQVFVLSQSQDAPPWMSSICAFGYGVTLFHDAQKLRVALGENAPNALILNCESDPEEFVQSQAELSALLHEVAHNFEVPVPILWVCSKNDLRPRLQAVRLGGAAFFTHPADVDSLLVKLDDLTNSHPPEPYRVLIVDDEPALAGLYSLVLRQAGMETCEIHDPFTVMAPLVEFRPDLILMDIYMPGCSGTELAAVIRQQEAYVSIPIVFLSVEADVSKQMEAMRRGGDDFLLKPVQPRFLVSAVTTRVSRSRILRNLMMRDSLTGLLNHTKTKEQLAIEVDRVKRLGHSISVAMIDIDHFKNVNDSYGHSTGDRVLRSLSRLLGQRLRQTDVIGRYGGEEFAVIMNGTHAEDAVRVLDEIRESFAQMVHYADGKEFRVTFSAGVAEAPPYADAENISEAADKALYEAKRTGRNRIVLAK